MKGSQSKILFIMQLPPPIHGVSVMNKLIKESVLINQSLKCDYVNLTTAKDINDLQKKRLSKYFFTLQVFAKVFLKLVSTRYKYVYVTLFPFGPAFIKDSLIIIMSKFFGFKVLLHLHTYGFKQGAQRSPRWKMYYKFVFNNTQVICLSERLTEDIEHIYTGEVFILPNGIPPVNFVNNYKQDQSPLRLLYLSNLILGKGILIIIDALEIIKNKGLNFHFRVVGAESDLTYKTLEELIIEKGLRSYVTLVGPKYNNEKYNEFKEAGVFLLPSNYDTFGLVLLEAMQFGVPCISTNIGGIPDVLGDGRGIILPEITAEALARSIEFLILNPQERVEMSRKGFDYFNQNYTVETFEKRLNCILNSKAEIISERLLHNKK
jgi:glycosyltransferase involved in cell wall biosynthesis